MSPVQPEHDAASNTQLVEPERLRRAVDGRCRKEAAILAIISLIAVWSIRIPIEPVFWYAFELVVACAFAIALCWASNERRRFRIGLYLFMSPVAVGLAARHFGSPVPYEMTAITTLGLGALALALISKTHRNLAMSIVSSGFLVLFAALISEQANALPVALIWISFCLWHMVANHWERVSACTPVEVHRGKSVRPLTVAVGIVLFVIGGLFFHGRATDANRFTWGFMPTSGGSEWSDPAAMSGVGSGDAAIAAKDHAESFGAVESEVFLESTESTLYDMFSDSIGQPKRKSKWERRQGMTSEKVIEAHKRTAKSERGGGSFSTSRTKPEIPPSLRDANERSVIQWIGDTGIRLSMNRYDTFDGTDWSQHESWKNEYLARVAFGEEAWYFDPRQKNQVIASKFQFSHGGIVKVLKLDSTRIPTPMMTAGVHIKDVDRPDFFGIDDDGTFFMPGRIKIPPLTVLHVASTHIMEDELLSSKALVLHPNHVPTEDLTAGQKLAATLANEVSKDEELPYLKLRAIVDHLRTEYSFDRQSESVDADPLHEFLTRKRGGDHLFATAAAVMAKSVGFNARLVSGFYVRPQGFDVGQGHASVVPEDVHVWVEVQLDDGRWMEIEPTPSYREPIYQPSHWLLAKQFAIAYWIHGLATLVGGTFLFLTRVVWFEIFARLLWLVVGAFSSRIRVRVLLWILHRRGILAGKPRQSGCPQRDWILALVRHDEQLESDARTCCDAADRLIFGEQLVDDWSSSANLLIRQLTTRYISHESVDETPTFGACA